MRARLHVRACAPAPVHFTRAPRERTQQLTHSPNPTTTTTPQAGVDIDAGEELVRRIKAMNPSLNTGFSGMVPFGDSFLVSGTDGVGTKLRLAFDLNKHDTVGRCAAAAVLRAAAVCVFAGTHM